MHAITYSSRQEQPAGHQSIIDRKPGLVVVRSPFDDGTVEQKIHYFAYDLPHSDANFVVAYSGQQRGSNRHIEHGRSSPSSGHI